VRVVVIGPLAASVLRFRGTLLQTMSEAGHDVLAVAPDDDEYVRTELASRAIPFVTVPMSRAGMNPLRDVHTLLALTRLLRTWRADCVLAFSSKPVVYGLLAARLAGVPVRSAMITGIGSALAGGGDRRSHTARWVLERLYRRSLRYADVVFFQNADDERLFRDRALVRPDQRVVRIAGSGVDLDHFRVVPLPPPPLVFLMICRLIRDKGVIEFVEASRIVGKCRPDARFQLLGPLDVNPTAITERQLSAWQEEGVVEYLGRADDVRPAWAAAQVCVLPSYHEGMPRVVLEAMSIGRAIITTDVPGCRETVRDGENGYLVRARDPVALAERMCDMIDQPDRLAGMGRLSRVMAEERFDVHSVNRVIMDALGIEADRVPTGRSSDG